MSHAYNTLVLKKPTNLSINSDLPEKARSLNINLSATLEQTLAEQLRSAQRAKWLSENKDAISAYNQFVETKGTFSDSIRKF